MKHQLQCIFLLVCFVLGLASVSSFPSLAFAQDSRKPTPEALMEKMTGKWVMRGTIDNEKVTHDVYVDRILNRQYVRIHEVSREKTAAGEPSYEAWIHIAWDNANKEFVVMWLDNTGVTNFSPDGVGHGKPDGDRIPFIWKLADGSGIHNTFAFERASDTWSWEIDNLDKSGKSSPFARVTLKRK
ncbi:MAG: hypothetical protein ACKVZH_22830 [Blastocatellia bacterium]